MILVTAIADADETVIKHGSSLLLSNPAVSCLHVGEKI